MGKGATTQKQFSRVLRFPGAAIERVLATATGLADAALRTSVHDDRIRAWISSMVVGHALIGLTVWQLASNALDGHRRGALVWAAVHTLVVLANTHVMKHSRIDDDSTWGPRLRWIMLIGQLGIGVVLIGLWGADDGRTGRGFWGVILVFLAVVWGVSEIRESSWSKQPIFGTALLAVSVVAVTAAIWLPADPPTRSLLVIGIALMAGQLGIVASSHYILRTPRGGAGIGDHRFGGKARRWAWRAGAAGFALGAGLLLFDAGWFFTIVIAGIVLGLMVATTSRGEWDVASLVFGFVVFWALGSVQGPSGAGLEPDPGGGEHFFVVFGDSYISGEGAGEYYEDTNAANQFFDPDPDGDPGTDDAVHRTQCRRSPTSWTQRLARDDEFRALVGDVVPEKVLFLACSGALARDVWANNQAAQVGGRPLPWTGQIGEFEAFFGLTGLGPQADERAAVSSRIELAIVSLGGNDSGFSEIGAACVVGGDCSEIAQAWLDRLDEQRPFGDKQSTLEEQLATAYLRIQEAVGADVPVLVTPYVEPANPKGCPESLLTLDEHRFLDGFVDELNAVVKAATVRAGVHYLDAMEKPMEGGRICDKFLPDMNFLAPSRVSGSLEDSLNPVNWIHNSLHPKPEGHHRMAQAAAAWLAAGRLDADGAPAGETDLYDVASLTEMLGADIDFCESPSDTEPAECRHLNDPGTWMLVQQVRLGRTAEVPLLLLFAGAWLLSLVWIYHLEGGPEILSPGYTRSRAERILHQVFRLTGLSGLDQQ